MHAKHGRKPTSLKQAKVNCKPSKLNLFQCTHTHTRAHTYTQIFTLTHTHARAHLRTRTCMHVVRLQAIEHERGPLAPAEHRVHLRRAIAGLQANEDCVHEWVRVEGRRHLPAHECESCGYELWKYGFVCESECEATVCFTCRMHRLPPQGWH